MSNAGNECGRRRLGKVSLVWCLSAAVTFGFASCRRPVATSPKTNVGLGATPADEALDSAREALAKQTDLTSCRAAVQQLNVHLSRHPETKQQLDDKEKERLQREFGLDKDELAEVGSATFTPLDVHHLDRCFLFRDAARSLDVDHLPPAERAAAAFAWVVRQVRLDARDEFVVPEQFVVRRGRGSAMERSLVFLALLDQLDINGALLAFPPKNKEQQTRRWLTCALVGPDIYLFDSQLGMPVPGRGGKTATLAEIREQPDVLRRLDAPGHPYDLTAEQVKGAEVFVGCPVSALSMRMQYLESEMGTNNKARLADNVSARVDRFRTAAGSALPVRTWDTPAEPNAPTRVLRLFLPPAEGGASLPYTYALLQLNGFAPASDAHLPIQAPRRMFFDLDLAPWEWLPESIRKLPYNVELGSRPRSNFLAKFVEFYTQPGQPRDLLLRGRLDEAINALVAKRDEIQKLNNLLAQAPNLEAGIADWSERAKKIQADFLVAKNRAAKDPAAAEELKAAADNIEAMWKAVQQPLSMLLVKAMSEPMNAELTYQSALCKHEMAERLETGLKRPGANPTAAEWKAVREEWKAASSRWDTFEQTYPASPAAAAARTLHARACEALGETGRAIDLLKNLSGPLTDLEKTARLYRAAQLQEKKNK